MIEQSLGWLSDSQDSDGSWKTSLGGLNGKVAVTCVAGIALLASGSTHQSGTYAKQLEKAVGFILENGGKESEIPGGEPKERGGNWNQVNWSLGYSGMFLGLAHRKCPDAKILERLRGLAAQIVKNQEGSGGWAHGPGGPNTLGYLELEIMSNYCLIALGLTRQAGVDVPQESVDRAVRYIWACSRGDGGVGYSTRAGQKGAGDPGRTAGAIMAFQSLKLTTHPFYRRMVRFSTQGLSGLYKGHVSPVMHFMAGGMAPHREGGKM